LPRLELEVLVVLLPPYSFIHVLSLDPCLHLEVHVPHLELGDAPVLRKIYPTKKHPSEAGKVINNNKTRLTSSDAKISNGTKEIHVEEFQWS
jgi:hypothetical protein